MISNFKTFESNLNNNNLNQNDNFWKWFDGSKVVDKNGNPLVVYHGSRNLNFDVFNTKHFMLRYGYERRYPLNNIKSEDISEKFLQYGSYFSNNISTASHYTNSATIVDCDVKSVYLLMKNPFVWDCEGERWIHILPYLFNSILGGDDPNFNRNYQKLYIEKSYNFGHRIGKNVYDKYDGVILNNINEIDSRGIHSTYIAFYPNYIKSVDNNGDYDINNDSIYK